MVAVNASGPRRLQAGACRDSLIGVRFIDGTGAVVKNGGRVMKNVTGYDLAKLMAGSWGTLGVLSEVSFKLLPAPAAEATLVFAGLDAEQAVQVMSKALGSPWEVNGAALGVIDAQGRGAVSLRIEGFASSVRYRLGQLEAALSAFGKPERVEDPQHSAQIWRDIRDVRVFKDHGFVARLSIKPSNLSGFVAALGTAYGDHPSQPDLMADWGGGLVWVAADDAAPQDAQSLIEWLQGYATQHGGHATLIKAPEALRRAVPSFQPEAAGVAALTKGLRNRFDPRGILNPGLME